MKQILAKCNKKENKQAVYLFAATIASVLLGVLSSVMNTRFLQPSDYGDIRYVQNILNFATLILLFGYFQSGSRMLAIANDEESCRRIKGVMAVILAICSIVMVMCCVLCYFIFINSKPQVAFLFMVSIPCCCAQLLSNYVNTTAQGDNQIGRLAISRVLPSILYVLFGYVVYSNWGATAERVILLQWGINTLICLFIIISTRPLFNGLEPYWQQIKQENKEYGIELYIGSLVMVATNYIAGITIGMFNTDNTEVGFYTLALTITSPLAMLPGIIGTTYFKKFASLNCIPGKVIKMTTFLCFVSFLGYIAIIKYVVAFLYSESYAQVGVYASWLAIGYTVHGLGDMFNRYLGSHGQGKAIRNSSIYNGVFKIFGYTVLVYLMGTKGAVLTTILCSCIYATSILYYYLKFTTKQSEEIH